MLHKARGTPRCRSTTTALHAEPEASMLMSCSAENYNRNTHVTRYVRCHQLQLSVLSVSYTAINAFGITRLCFYAFGQ
eukprot:6478669-Amphidinium_carterae.1